MRNRESINPTGYLEIFKIFPDGRQELHWADNNVITSGMGVGLAALYSEEYEGVDGILNFQIKYFQVGVSGTSNYGVSTIQLVSAVSSTLLSAGSLVLTSHLQHLRGTNTTNQTFIEISHSNIYRVSQTAVRYHLIIPADSGNNIGVPINEVGLYMKNPFNIGPPPSSLLVAYKYFSPILKTEDFALLFRWQINF
jgi:hypothetical protein